MARNGGAKRADKATNRSLVRIFSICLGGLAFCYALLGLRLFVGQQNFDALQLILAAGRVAIGAAGLVAVFYPPWLARPLERQVDAMGSQFEAAFTRTSNAEKIRLIVLVTMLSLLLELVMIRWLASVFPVFSFFKNFTLLACFLGLGAGYAVAEKQRCAPALVLPMLALFVAVIMLLRYDVGAETVVFGALPMIEQTSVQVTMDSFDWLNLLRLGLPLYLLLSTCFVLCACICYPVGQLCGKLLHSAQAQRAYGFNLIGSILGVLALFVMSLFWLPPVVWFAAVGGVLLVFVLARDKRLPLGVASFCVLVAALAWPVQPGTQRIYSPYQLLERTAKPDGLMQIQAGGYFYQGVYDLSERNRGHESAHDRFIRAYYEFPFNFKKKPGDVAIVGAGSGNDVAAALRMGAGHVDAIEIDPAIAFLGEKYHPEHPYDDKRVTLTINDARNFFRTARQKLDLIVYGVLDSHTALSHASNLRVDSYVYTREGLTEAFKLLKPGGVLSVAFALPNDSLGFKLWHILAGIPGAGKPLAVRAHEGNQTITAFIAEKGGDVAMPDAASFAAIGFTDVSKYFAQAYPESSIPTDDWPFFYMIKRTYPVSYMIALGLVLLLSVFFVRNIIGLSEPVERGYLPFFFLGSGFMLVETKAITELGLHLGGTWYVIAATIVSVLLMAFFANLIVLHKLFRRTGVAYGGLLASLLVGYVYARHHELLVLSSPLASLLVSCVLLTIPLFFSGIVFSSLIGRAKVNISTALAYNLMGALFGGLMEYNSMYFGFAFLYLLAIGFYGLAWLFSLEPAARGARLPAQGSLAKSMATQLRSVFTLLGL
jgi:SAM-dependent methyltransferase